MQKDTTKKSCLSDNERYADLINGLIFQGKQVVHAEDLADMDSQSGMWSKGFLQGKWKRKQKYRDLIKKATLDAGFVVIGVENQEEAHYLMPLRSMSYDVAEYERQAASIRKQVRKRKLLAKAEFLSGFTKENKLMPCVTLVLYYGKDWDGSLDLHGILEMQNIPEEMKPYVNNYSIHLIEVRKLENTDVFRTDLKQIFDFIRYSEDKNKLKELVRTDPVYQEMDEDAYDMAVTYADAEELIAVKKYHGKDGKVNMCKGLREWMEDERMEGCETGQLLTKVSLVRKKSVKGMDIATIAELLEEDEALIATIVETIIANPAESDEDIAKRILKH